MVASSELLRVLNYALLLGNVRHTNFSLSIFLHVEDLFLDSLSIRVATEGTQQISVKFGIGVPHCELLRLNNRHVKVVIPVVNTVLVVALTLYSYICYGPYSSTVLSLHNPQVMLHCFCQRRSFPFRSFCVLVFTVFFYCFVYVYLFFFGTSVRTTATE